MLSSFTEILTDDTVFARIIVAEVLKIILKKNRQRRVDALINLIEAWLHSMESYRHGQPLWDNYHLSPYLRAYHSCFM